MDAPFSDHELERYARHIILREIGGLGQKRLRQSRVAVIGAGGLGSAVLLYLAAAGVGRIVIFDNDVVSLSNLQRQVIFAQEDLGVPKVAAAARAIRKRNENIEVECRQERFSEASDCAEITVLIDGSDNFQTRRMSNGWSLKHGVPLVFGAMGPWEGQVSIFQPGKNAPCYACLFPDDPAPGTAPSCAEGGVVGALAGVIGAMMALETIKLIAEAGESLTGRLLLFDALAFECRTISFNRRFDCTVCSAQG